MSFDPIDAAKKASFVAFAYNMFTPGNLQPAPDPGIAAAGFRLAYYLNASDFNDREFYGYLAVSQENPGTVVLAIRGTQDAAEWILDFLAIPVPFAPQPDAGFVALGFLSIFDSFQFVPPDGGAALKLNDAIASLSALAPIQSLTVIGHSLGGALARLAAAELALTNPGGVREKLAVYTFGSPRVGLLDFAASFDRAVPTSFRIWNSLDIVPQVPTFPYIHVSGKGDEIVQTAQQLETLVHTPACEHHLTSYQWLLDPTTFPLDTECNATAPAPEADVLTLTVRTRVIVNTQARGAAALSKAMRGRL